MGVQLRTSVTEAHKALTSYATEIIRLQREVSRVGESSQKLTYVEIADQLAKLHRDGLRLSSDTLAAGAHALKLEEALASEEVEKTLCRFSELNADIDRKVQAARPPPRPVETRVRLPRSSPSHEQQLRTIGLRA